MQKIILSQAFINILFDAQQEAVRSGICYVSTLELIKSMMYNPSCYLYEYLNDGLKIDWEKLDNAVKRCEKNQEKTSMENTISMDITSQDEDTMQIITDPKLYQLILDSDKYGVPPQYVCEEIAFMLSLINNSKLKEVVSFFSQIGVNIAIMERYYKGLLMQRLHEVQVSSDEFDSEYDSEFDEEYDEDQEEEYEDVEIIDKPNAENINNATNQYQETSKSSVQLKKTIEIPKELKDCLTVIHADISKENLILGRDNEKNKLIKVLLKYKKSNAILVGLPGVGKTAIVESLVYDIESGNCPSQMKNKLVVSLNINSIISGTTLRGMLEKKFKILTNFLARTRDIILFVDEIHTIIGAGQGMNDSLDLANILKPLLARTDIAVIGATTDEEYNKCFSRDKAFKRRFETIIVKEPSFDETYPMIKKQIENLSTIHNVQISKNIVEYIIRIAPCFNFESRNPDCSLDLIDKAMATAKMQGKGIVTKEIVLSNFEANFKLYKKMDLKMKKAIAYHEAGHYIVERYSKIISKQDALAVSIIPSSNLGGSMGVTVTDTQNENLIEWNYDAYIEEIAVFLAGRVGEKMYAGFTNSGASSDLKKATDIAKKMLLEYGLVETFSKRYCKNDINRRTSHQLNHEIDKIIDEAQKKAETILEEHSTLLEEIANKLLKDGIIMGPDLEKICKKNEKNKSIKKSLTNET